MREGTCWHVGKWAWVQPQGTRVSSMVDSKIQVAGGSSGWQVAGGLCAKGDVWAGVGVEYKRRGLGIIKILALALALALALRSDSSAYFFFEAFFDFSSSRCGIR